MSRLAWLVCGFVLALESSAHGIGTDRASGFDHVWHEGQIFVSGKAAVSCDACHTIDQDGTLVGRPDHNRCFAVCHTPMPPSRVLGRPYRVDEDLARQCRTCHSADALADAARGGRTRLTVSYPPYGIGCGRDDDSECDIDFSIQMSHAKHDRAATETGRDCGACHMTVGTSARPSTDMHARCAACHARAVDVRTGVDEPDTEKRTQASGARMPPMTACTACHRPAHGPRTRPSMNRGAFPVTKAFSHARHASVEPLRCRTCHTAVARVDTTELPSPTMAACQSCHNGTRAFRATGPTCRRCHTRPALGVPVRSRQIKRFEHTNHQMANIACVGCHELDERGTPKPPSSDHMPCANSGCHEREFASRAPTICTACHVGSEPWRPLHFDRSPPAETHFGARFSHRSHMGKHGMKRDCTDCHQRSKRPRDMRRERGLSRDHDSCQGSGCHTHRGGAPPTLQQCERCHESRLIERQQAERLARPFSVRARFRHAVHERDPRTETPMACVVCHTGVDEASNMREIPTPAKSACQGCHDGSVAFKVTGHGCARCHGSSR